MLLLTGKIFSILLTLFWVIMFAFMNEDDDSNKKIERLMIVLLGMQLVVTYALFVR